jgi:hypothetical protein
MNTTQYLESEMLLAPVSWQHLQLSRPCFRDVQGKIVQEETDASKEKGS